jgi:hypothetical protein
MHTTRVLAGVNRRAEIGMRNDPAVNTELHGEI